jgi:RNA polymerase sigma factor (TIGR02999 family)
MDDCVVEGSPARGSNSLMNLPEHHEPQRLENEPLMESQTIVTRLLHRLDSGDGEAAAELFPLVYDELRRLAKCKLADEKVGHTLQATALVNEVYVRLVGGKQSLTYESRRRFFLAAAEAMRHILVDSARRRMAQKRGGTAKREELDLDCIPVDRPSELLDIHNALDALAEKDPQCAELVKLHYFGGYSLAQVAELFEISRSTANRWWIYAKAFLKAQL